MPKSKVKKPPPVIKPEFVLEEKKGPQPPKKRKKNAPDKPQPEWMFPPDDENPVLNPKPKTEERRLKEEKDKENAIKFLKYKSVTAPMKAPPPNLLLTLIGGFLSSYGFNSTSRIYSTQLQSRKKLDEWALQLDVPLPKGFPDLVRIYKEWYKEYEGRTKIDETSSSSGSDSEVSEATKSIPKSKTSKKSATAVAKAGNDATIRANAKNDTSSSGSSGGSESSNDEDGSEVDKKDVLPLTSTSKGSRTSPTVKAPSASTSSSSSSSSSDSDADDEKEPAGAQLSLSSTASKLVANESAKSRKRAASSSSSSSDTSSSDSDSDELDFSKPPSSTPIVIKTTSSSKTIKLNKTPSDSSETLQATSTQKPSTADTSITASSSNSSTDSVALAEAVKRKRSPSPVASNKHHKKQNTPFQRVPKDTPVDPRMSNAYKPYDYADRAHQDLSVTKGKGFTKEKNKKKRGSYRGGAIDVSGGKGIKFED